MACTPVGVRLDLVPSIFFVTWLLLGDPAQNLVSTLHSGSGKRIRHLPLSRQRLLERWGPSLEQENLTAPAAYRNNEELLEAMKLYADKCGHISRLYSIGKSVRGVPLMVLEISDFPGQYEAEPAFKYVGNMHGDEPSGRELTLYLAEWLCLNYLRNPLATLIVQNVHLHLLPSMNPDGFASKTRNNANDIDLNRDFPDQFHPANNNESQRQPETKAIMQWIRNIRFSASSSLHEGALVASYGWDGTVTGRTGYAESPDDAGFRYMASLYSQFNPSMKKNPEFAGGITNGAAWYPLYGGMQDWNYIYGDCFEITIEMTDSKWPDISKIPGLWKQHQSSLLELVASLVTSGVHGRVMSSDGRPLSAQITVKGNKHSVNASSHFGDYHRILAPGKIYELTASYPGYTNRTTTIILSRDKAAKVDFILDPLPSEVVYTQEPFQAMRVFNRNPIFEDVTEHRPRVPVTDTELSKEQDFSNRAQMLSSWFSGKQMRSFDRSDMMSEVTAEQMRLISATGTLILLAAIFFILVRWRRSVRAQTARHYGRTPTMII